MIGENKWIFGKGRIDRSGWSGRLDSWTRELLFFWEGGILTRIEINIYEEKEVEFVNVLVVCIAEAWSVNGNRKKSSVNKVIRKKLIFMKRWEVQVAKLVNPLNSLYSVSNEFFHLSATKFLFLTSEIDFSNVY